MNADSVPAEVEKIAAAILKDASDRLRRAAEAAGAVEAASSDASEQIFTLVDRIAAGESVSEAEIASAFVAERAAQDLAAFYSLLMGRLKSALDIARQNRERAAALSTSAADRSSGE